MCSQTRLGSWIISTIFVYFSPEILRFVKSPDMICFSSVPFLNQEVEILPKYDLQNGLIFVNIAIYSQRCW